MNDLRDQFALAALPAIIALQGDGFRSADAAKAAWKMAAAMIRSRDAAFKAAAGDDTKAGS